MFTTKQITEAYINEVLSIDDIVNHKSTFSSDNYHEITPEDAKTTLSPTIIKRTIVRRLDLRNANVFVVCNTLNDKTKLFDENTSTLIDKIINKVIDKKSQKIYSFIDDSGNKISPSDVIADVGNENCLAVIHIPLNPKEIVDAYPIDKENKLNEKFSKSIKRLFEKYYPLFEYTGTKMLRAEWTGCWCHFFKNKI